MQGYETAPPCTQPTQSLSMKSYSLGRNRLLGGDRLGEVTGEVHIDTVHDCEVWNQYGYYRVIGVDSR